MMKNKIFMFLNFFPSPIFTIALSEREMAGIVSEQVRAAKEAVNHLLLDKNILPFTLGIFALIYGRMPRPPHVLSELNRYEIAQWASAYAIIYPTIGSFEHSTSLVAVALLYGLRYALDKGHERYYDDMYIYGEPAVEGRFSM